MLGQFFRISYVLSTFYLCKNSGKLRAKICFVRTFHPPKAISETLILPGQKVSRAQQCWTKWRAARCRTQLKCSLVPRGVFKFSCGLPHPLTWSYYWCVQRLSLRTFLFFLVSSDSLVSSNQCRKWKKLFISYQFGMRDRSESLSVKIGIGCIFSRSKM